MHDGVPTDERSSKPQVKARPRWLKALGLEISTRDPANRRRAASPARSLQARLLGGHGLYEGPRGRACGSSSCTVRRRFLGCRMGWLGRRTARNERSVAGATGRSARDPGSGRSGSASTDRCSRMPSPASTSPAIRWVTARPFLTRSFHDLHRLLQEMHERRTVYVDLHKRENIIVTERGEPCLIDFQISLSWPRWLPRGRCSGSSSGATNTT